MNNTEIVLFADDSTQVTQNIQAQPNEIQKWKMTLNIAVPIAAPKLPIT